MTVRLTISVDAAERAALARIAGERAAVQGERLSLSSAVREAVRRYVESEAPAARVLETAE